MLTCQLMGGLGNQLFQIFALISLSIDTKHKFVLPIDVNVCGTKRHAYWDSILCKLKFFTVKQVTEFKTIKEKSFRYNRIELSNNENFCLYGYFQSYKYFQRHYDSIYKMIGIDKLQTNIKNQMSYIDLPNTIGMHFRLGDYKEVQQYHPILTFNYYKSALSYITNKLDSNTKTSVLYFCEEEDVRTVEAIIYGLTREFPHVVFVRASNSLSDWEQLILMSCCSHNIIANSSFSWWGAYFNTNPNKIVCYPSKWFGPALKHDTSDLCPEEWIRV
jgi:hypothetical protein